jgi:hypothetical protein
VEKWGIFFIDQRGLKINENLFFFKLFFEDSRKNPEISDYIDYETITQIKKHIENAENLFNHFLKSILPEVFDIISMALLETSFFDISRRLDYVLRYHKKNSGTHHF